MSRFLIALAASALWAAQCAPLPAEEAGEITVPLLSEEGCLPARDMAVTLQQHGQVPVAFGVQNAGDLTQIWAAPDGSTWAAVVTTPQGKACVVAQGKGWETSPAIAAGPPA